jgi:hypothetical protein
MLDDAEQRRRQPRLQGRQVFAEARHRRIDAVGHPAGQRQAAGGDRLLGQQRMVDAAQAHADDQDHRQGEQRRQVGGVAGVAERHAETADALDQDRRRPASAAWSKRSGDVRQFDAPAFLRGGDVRRDRGAETVGIDQFAVRLHRRRREQALDVLVASVLVETGGDRFHRHSAHAGRRKACSSAQATKVLPISVSVPVMNQPRGIVHFLA